MPALRLHPFWFFAFLFCLYPVSTRAQYWTELTGTELSAALSSPRELTIDFHPIEHDDNRLWFEAVRGASMNSRESSGRQQPFNFRIPENIELTRLTVYTPQTGGETLHSGGPISNVTLPWPNYPAMPGIYDVTLTAVRSSGQERTFRFTLYVTPPAQRVFRYRETGYQPMMYGQNCLELSCFYNLYSDVHFTDSHWNTIMVWQGGDRPLDKVSLIIEGIDTANSTGPEEYYGLGFDLFQAMRGEGGDVAILDFMDGGRDLVENAAVVETAIDLLSRYRSDKRRGLDVVGLSMGGVLARYALARMEQNIGHHAVSRFVSMDAPQRGAVVDLEFQRYLLDHSCGLAQWAPVEACIPPTMLPRDLWSRAGQQLLVQNAFDTSSPSKYVQFFSALRALNGGRGYPQLTTNVGVSFGTAAPNPNAGERWASFVWPQWFNGNFNVTGPLAQGGSYLPRYAGISWQSFAGLWGGIDRTNDPTFIPFTSSLDNQNGSISPFEQPLIYGDFAEYHDVIPFDIIPILLRRLGYTLPNPPLISISGPTRVAPGQPVTLTATTPAGPASGYSYSWEYRIYLAGSSCGPTRVEGVSEQGADTTEKPSDPNRESCGVWHEAYEGFRPRFTFTNTGGLSRIEFRVTATDYENAVPATRTVYVTAGNELGEGETEGEETAGRGTTETPEAREGVSDDPTAGATVTPSPFALAPIAPNPLGAGSTPHGVVRFSLSETGPITLALYDALGRTVAVLVNGTLGAGSHETALDVAGLPGGAYILRLTSRSHAATQRVSILR